MRHTGAAGVLIAVLAVGPASAQVFEVGPEIWDRPRTGRIVAGHDPVRRAVAVLLAHPESRLHVRHGSSQEAVLQAEELKSWLAALAVDPRRIDLQSEVRAGATLRLEVTR